MNKERKKKRKKERRKKWKKNGKETKQHIATLEPTPTKLLKPKENKKRKLEVRSKGNPICNDI